MKKVATLLLLLLCCSSFAQLGLKISHIRPTGNMGMTLKPAPGLELIYKDVDDSDESHVDIRFGLGLAKFTPRKDTFPTVGVIHSSGTTVTPGYFVIHKYNLVTIEMGVDYMIRLSEQLYLYPGVDLGVLFTAVEYNSYFPLIVSEGYSGGSTFLSARLRGGAEYSLNDNIRIFTEFNRSMNFSPEVGGLAYNDYGIGIRLNF